MLDEYNYIGRNCEENNGPANKISKTKSQNPGFGLREQTVSEKGAGIKK